MIRVISFSLLTLLLLAACGPQVDNEKFQEITWKWVSLTEAEPASVSVVPNPGAFTLYFEEDGSYRMQVDCNAGAGSYLVSGSSLDLAAGPSLITQAFCGEESLDSLFLQHLNGVESFELDGDRLVLESKEGQVEMIFEQE